MRREIRLFVCSALLGLLTTVAVAVLLTPLDTQQGVTSSASALLDEEELWSVTRWDRVGAMTIKSTRSRGLSWGTQQAAGPPDTPRLGDQVTAWASAGSDSSDEWLILHYAKPVIARRLDVYESYNPGAVVRVTVFDAAGNEFDAWEGQDPCLFDAKGKPVTTFSTVQVSKVPIALDVPTNKVKIYIDSKKFAGWNEIDAVALVDDKGQFQWARKVEASSTYASAGSSGTANGYPDQLTPAWSGLQHTPEAMASGLSNRDERQVDARGWPMLALWTSTDLLASPPGSPGSAPGQSDAALLDLSLGESGAAPPAMPSGPSAAVRTGATTPGVPFRPIWGGLLVNTAIYGAAWGVLWLVLVVPRRFIREVARFRRGACIECGYDLGYDFIHGCPECGWRRDRQADRAPSRKIAAEPVNGDN